jgi:hypothetical protein
MLFRQQALISRPALRLNPHLRVVHEFSNSNILDIKNGTASEQMPGQDHGEL